MEDNRTDQDRFDEQEALREKLREHLEGPPRTDPFTFKAGNKDGLGTMTAGVTEYVKRKKKSSEDRVNYEFINVLHLSGEKNAAYLVPGFKDKYNLVYKAGREYLKGYVEEEKITVYLPDGRHETAALCTDYNPDNLSMPAETATEKIKLDVREIERSRRRVVQDHGTKNEIDMDDRQIKLMALTGLFCLVGGIGIGVIGTFLFMG